MAVGYLVMLVVATGLFFLIRAYGETLTAPATEGGRRGLARHTDILLHVLLTLAAVILLGQLLGRLAGLVGQPAVLGEIVAGVALGPSILNHIHPDATSWLLPADAAPHLGTVAQIGAILYMFLVGLELNWKLLRNKAGSAIAISHASIAVPFIFGAALALLLYPRLSSDSVPFTSFALFMGVALSITAFPVLARILTDRGLSKSQLGALALTCAAADDVTAWCLLALVVGVAQSRAVEALLVLGLALAFIAVMFLIVRPAMVWLTERQRQGEPSHGVLALVFVALLLAALASDAIGIHPLFGAFLLGAVIPHDSDVARAFTQQLGDLVRIALLPAFFAFTGMRTQIDLISGWESWFLCGLIILTATAGKYGGTVTAARLTGCDWRTASALGILMNTRGLMELIVLNIGLDLGVISPTLFAMMVLMALATTFATTPLLTLVLRRPPRIPLSAQPGE